MGGARSRGSATGATAAPSTRMPSLAMTGTRARVRCGRCGLFFDRYNEGETLVVDGLGYASLFCFACAYPLLYGLDDFSAEARDEVASEIERHGWRLLRDLPDEVEAD